MRAFGRTNVRVSALGLGGHHLGQAPDEPSAIRIVQEAVDGGVTFFDNCWEYNRGVSELLLGKGLAGRRDRVFLMTKVCTHGRERAIAEQMLHQSLKRLQTDHLDLWQVHGVTFYNDPELFMRPNGAAEALLAAKKAGKVRYLGFTGHKDPNIHLKMLATGFPFDAVQMPLNAFDATFRSFEKSVLPELTRRGIAALGMKPLNGGRSVEKGAIGAEDALRYAMSLPVATTITGCDKLEVLHQALRVAQNFQPMSAQEMQAMRDRASQTSGDGRFELYKTSIKYDNPEARLAHEFPMDPKNVETQQMLNAVKNNGHPYEVKPAGEQK